MPEAATAEVPKKKAPPPKKNVHYGLDFDVIYPGAPANQLNVELAVYKDRLESKDPQCKRLPREFHFRKAFDIVWPKFQWNQWCELMIWAWCNFRVICVIGHTRASKCLAKGTPVLKYDGTILPVEEVKVGDVLMGDDSKPRNVLSLARGREMMYRIKAKRGDGWVCNGSHILTLKASHNKRHSKGHFTHLRGEERQITAAEFATKGPYFRSTWKQYQVGVSFPELVGPLECDPYAYGVWLAEGTRRLPSITATEGPMTRAWCQYWEIRGARISVNRSGSCPTWFARFRNRKKYPAYKSSTTGNPCTAFHNKSGKTGRDRFIIHDFKVASERERLELLAGYLDGDGCITRGVSATFQSVSRRLAEDIQFVARSLGFGCSLYERKTSCKSRNYIGTAWQGRISGDITRIPMLEKLMRARPRENYDPLCQTIQAEPIGEGNYYGFSVDGNQKFLLGDFTVTHNSYFFSFLVLLDYLAASPMTATTLTTTKFDALKTRMWGDMMRAIEAIENPTIQQGIEMMFKITNTSNEMKFASASESHGDDKFMIQGVATDSADKSAGKIRGQHADRRRIVGDEAQDIAPVIYKAIANAISAPDFVGGLLSNPVERNSDFGKWCKPKNGWGSIHDTDLVWETETPGGVCLHFDGLQSPNIKAGKTLFPYLLDQAYIDFIRKQFGEDSLEWWMYIRGFFPPDGIVSRVWPSATIEKAKASIDFDFPPYACASLDPAYEYDDPVLTIALMGRGRDSRPCCVTKKQIRISLKQSDTMTKDRQLANETARICAEEQVLPENFICDTTGNGRSVYALLFEAPPGKWGGSRIQKVEYGGSATDRPLRLNDTKPSNEQVKYFVAELWFRASYLAADGILCGFNNLDPKCEDDLTARRYTIKQDGDRKVMVVETKDEMKKRLGRSPDYGDSLCQLGELMVRKGLLGEIMPSGGGGANRWAEHRKQARKANSRFSEKKEFSFRG